MDPVSNNYLTLAWIVAGSHVLFAGAPRVEPVLLDPQPAGGLHRALRSDRRRPKESPSGTKDLNIIFAHVPPGVYIFNSPPPMGKKI